MFTLVRRGATVGGASGQTGTAQEDVVSEIHLWGNKPTAVDLLGFTSIVDTVAAARQAPDLDPVTIGVHAPWGGGKSTVLGLLKKERSERRLPGDPPSTYGSSTTSSTCAAA